MQEDVLVDTPQGGREHKVGDKADQDCQVVVEEAHKGRICIVVAFCLQGSSGNALALSGDCIIHEHGTGPRANDGL